MAFIKCSGGGSGKCNYGSVSVSGSNVYTINCGFRPKYIVTHKGAGLLNVYDENYSTTGVIYAGTGTYTTFVKFTASDQYKIKSITDNGFTYKHGSGNAGDITWFAASD